MILQPDFKEFIALLNSKSVEYLIVGGYAVGFHGRPRYTGDMDFWINNSPENAQLIKESLDVFGFASFNIKASEFEKENLVFQLGHEPVRIDILTTISGVDFKDCYRRKVSALIDGVTIPFINIADLKINKASTGRAKDLGDLESL
jgi:predicted nucleotidyltransferase